MMRVTRAIAKRIKLHLANVSGIGISYIGESLSDFIEINGLRYGFDLIKYNAKLQECGLRRITAQEYEKAKAEKTTYHLVSDKDMKHLAMLINCMLEEYKEPPYRKQWQEFSMWISNGKFKTIKK
jgi:hypothetical protein